MARNANSRACSLCANRPPGSRSMEAFGSHTYSEAASWTAPFGQSGASSGGGWTTAQSAKVVVRAHSATPSAPLSATRPWTDPYQAAYPASGGGPGGRRHGRAA